mgnify:CR=1 FL=1
MKKRSKKSSKKLKNPKMIDLQRRINLLEKELVRSEEMNSKLIQLLKILVPIAIKLKTFNCEIAERSSEIHKMSSDVWKKFGIIINSLF